MSGNTAHIEPLRQTMQYSPCPYRPFAFLRRAVTRCATMASDTEGGFSPSALGRAHHSACVHRIGRQTEALRAEFCFA